MSSHDGSQSNESGSGTLAERLPRVVEALNQAHVAWVHIPYEVRQHVGSVSAPHYYTGAWVTLWPDLSAELHGELVAFFTELLKQRYPGWADVEGVDGLFQWDVCANILQHSHSVPTGNAQGHEVQSFFVEGL